MLGLRLARHAANVIGDWWALLRRSCLAALGQVTKTMLVHDMFLCIRHCNLAHPGGCPPLTLIEC